jgi:hypothetical protein
VIVGFNREAALRLARKDRGCPFLAAPGFGLVPALGYVPASIPHLVSLEMRLIDASRRIGSLTPIWHGAVVTVFRMETIVNVAMEVGRTVKPRAGADENAAAEPFWTVVTGWRTAIRSNVVIAVGAFRSYADTDAHLSICDRDSQCEAGCRHGRQKSESTHRLTAIGKTHGYVL